MTINRIICHRGAIRTLENTLTSIVGINNVNNSNNLVIGVEFDIQITNDNQLICYHDYTLERIHKLNKKTIELSIDDCVNLNIATLNQILENIINPNVLINIEMKAPININIHHDVYNAKLEIFCRLVLDKIHLNYLNNEIMISTFDYDLLNILIELINNYNTKSNIKIAKISENFDLGEIIELKSRNVNNFVFDKILLDVINNCDVLKDCDIFLYTFFDINDEGTNNTNLDEKLINKIQKSDKKISIITDNLDNLNKLIIFNN